MLDKLSAKISEFGNYVFWKSLK